MTWICWLGQALFQWQALSALATAVAALVVWKQVGSLSEQVKVQSDQLRLQIYSDYTKRYQAIVMGLPEDINSATFKLTSKRKDYASTMRSLRTYYDLSFEQWDLHRRKLIDEESWKIWSGGIAAAMSKSAFRQGWKIALDSKTEYGKDFESFIQKLVNG